MTININYVVDDFALIMSDRRLSKGLKGDFGYTDDNKKVVNVRHMGWFTGAGLYNFITPFVNTISKSGTLEIDEIVEIYKELNKEVYDLNPEYREKLEDSSVSFSFVTGNGLTNFPKLYIGYLNSDSLKGDTLQVIPDDCFRIIRPSDYQGEIEDLKVFSNEYTENRGSKKLEDVIKRFLLIFKELLDGSNLAIEECDIGIYRKNGRGFSKYILSGNVNDLLTSHDSGKILELINSIR
ncbi:hypothetical protein GCM10008931_38990 [Oceanobacillus oncorhynchi subsp. oncorhynchi]|uniref:hypothetical protein n=1 Tax=Oceanobacillus oncorhynchi TaxID=545501 RepID=UPI0031DA31DC